MEPVNNIASGEDEALTDNEPEVGDPTGEDEEDALRLEATRVGVEGEDDVTLWLVKLPETRRGMRPKAWCFCRNLEYLLYGSLDNSSCLLHAINELELAAAVRHCSSKELFGMTPTEYKQLVTFFNTSRKELDPLASNKGRSVTLIPKQVACTLALHRSTRDMARGAAVLRALGAPVPDRVSNELERRQHDVAGELNLSLPDPEDEDPGKEELYEVALQNEVLELDFGSTDVVEEESRLGRMYALQNPSQLLLTQLESLKEFRTKILNAFRRGSKVTEITVASDISTAKRFLGWLTHHHSSGTGLDFGVFRHPNIAQWIQEFCDWLVTDREVSYATIAGTM